MIAKILQRDKPTAVSRRTRCNQNCRNAAKQTAGAHKGEQETVQFFIFGEIQNANEDNLYRAKVEGKVRLGEYAAVRFFVGNGIIENFNNFRNDSAVEENGAHGTEVLLSQKEEQADDNQDGYADTKQMFKPKQTVVCTKNRRHKSTSFVNLIKQYVNYSITH